MFYMHCPVLFFSILHCPALFYSIQNSPALCSTIILLCLALSCADIVCTDLGHKNTDLKKSTKLHSLCLHIFMYSLDG
jgi:hypothetical protein